MTTGNRTLRGQTAPPGMLTVRILEQGDVWQDLHGNVHQLDDMDTDHLANLEPFLLRKHGETLRWNWMVYQTERHCAVAPVVLGVDADGRDILGPSQPIWSDHGGNMDAVFDEWMDYEMGRPLAEWLAGRPLVRRIRAIIAERPDRDGPVFAEGVPF